MSITLNQLHRFPFLRPLDPTELKELAQQIQVRHYPTNTVIFPDGEIGDKFYLLDSGRVQIFKPTSAGEVLLNDLHPGDPFGEMSLLDGQPRSATARAEGDVTVLEIPKEIFLSLIRRYPVLLYQTATYNAQRLRARDLEMIEELKTRNQELHELYETSLDISRHLELDKVLTAIAERAAGLMNGTAGDLHLYDAGKRLLLGRISGKHVRPGEGAAGRAFIAGEPIIQNRANRRGRAQGQCELAAPIQLNEKTLGALTVYRVPPAPPFTQDDAQLLRLLANQAAIAIENARLYELSVEKGRLDGELRVARQVQRSLLPTRAPRVPGFQLAGAWRPAREVAGDFYDFIPLPEHRWGIVIADVSDKGVPAALFMAVSRSILRASALAAQTPVGAIERANRVIAADASGGMFVTVFFGILDPRARSFTYVNAGHNPPLLARANHTRLEPLGHHALALGIHPDIRYESHQVKLEEGDVLVLYTDGVTEAVNADDEFFGDARLAEIIHAQRGGDAAAVLHAIDHGVHEFIGTRPLYDDVTLVVLSVHAKK